jgi:L-lysine exporter family protein LysE/ArgO
MPIFFLSFGEGFVLGASLIVAIGAQNAFVLRQGLKREHVFFVAAFCALADLLLIVAGVFGLGALVRNQGWFLALVTWGGAAFLVFYGVKATLRVWHPSTMADENSGSSLGLGAVGATLAAFTFLNPHVYLDTVLLLGGMGARRPLPERPWYAAGASLASVLWFFGLAYGARFLTPLFRRPFTWRILDALIALVMFSLAAGLVLSGTR